MSNPTHLARLALTLIASSALTLPLNAAVIDLPATAKSVTGLIRLVDIALIDEADPLVQRQLENVSLGPAPAAGRKIRITQQMIRQRLLAHGANLSDIEFTGQSVVIVDVPAVPVEDQKSPPPKLAASPVAVRPLPVNPVQKKKAVDVIQQAFHRQYLSAGSDVGPLTLTVEIRDEDVPLLLPTDPSRIRFVEPGLEWGGPQALTAQFPEADGATRVVHLQAWLNEAPQIVTVKHTIPKGVVLKDSDLALVPAKTGETGLNHGQELIGQETTRDLRPGQALQRRDVAKSPLVRSNDLVTVKVRTPGLSVSRMFRATSNGGLGETVNLVALENPQEKVQATVTGWHEAEMATPTVNDVSAMPDVSRKRARSPRTKDSQTTQGARS